MESVAYTDVIPVYFELCMLIVHTLKMCNGDARPEQSLVLFPFMVAILDAILNYWNYPKRDKVSSIRFLKQNVSAFQIRQNILYGI